MIDIYDTQCGLITEDDERNGIVFVSSSSAEEVANADYSD